jgi:hypothetical protein
MFSVVSKVRYFLCLLPEKTGKAMRILQSQSKAAVSGLKRIASPKKPAPFSQKRAGLITSLSAIGMAD